MYPVQLIDWHVYTYLLEYRASLMVFEDTTEYSVLDFILEMFSYFSQFRCIHVYTRSLTVGCMFNVPHVEIIAFKWSHHCRSRAEEYVGLCMAPTSFEEGGIFIVPHLMLHGTSVFAASSPLPLYSRLVRQARGGGGGGLRTYSNLDPHGVV